MSLRRALAALAVVAAGLAGCASAEPSVERAGSDSTSNSTVDAGPDSGPGSGPGAGSAPDPDRSAVTSAGTSTTGPTATTTAGVPSTTGPSRAVGTDSCPAPLTRRAPAADRPRYDVDIVADPITGRVSGSQRLRFTPDLPTDVVAFRLWANGPRPSSVGTSITVSDVTERVDGRDVARPTNQPDATTLVIGLGRTVEAGTTVDVAFDWVLQVEGPVNDRISRQGESLRLGSFVPLLAWQPGVGWAIEPPTSGFAESTTSAAAAWRYTVTAPAGFDVVATGEGAGGTYVADPARDIAVAVGRFTTVEAVANAPDPVQVTVSVHDGIDDPQRYLGQLVAHLERTAELYGPYPWPRYDLSITADLSGGIEFPMHVLQGPSTDGRTTPHEVAHMWFYGLVGNNQALHPYLDEGLATYVEGRLLGTLGSMRSRTIPADGRGRAAAPMTYWERRSGSYYRSVYVQTAAALSRLGDLALVDCALARFVAANAHTIATPSDLDAALDAVFSDWRPTLQPAGLG